MGEADERPVRKEKKDEQRDYREDEFGQDRANKSA